MNPHYFGRSKQQLFGIYHPPTRRTQKREAILIAAPIAQEYSRSRWSCRRLAEQLAAAGFHSMRFDYSGMGDSWGDFADFSPEQWVEDIKTAVQDLRDEAGISTVSMVAVRFGAALAIDAASTKTVDNLVCWDPVLNGQEYLNELRRIQQVLIDNRIHGVELASDASSEEIVGYRFSSDAIDYINSTNGDSLPCPKASRIHFVITQPDANVERLAKTWLDQGIKVSSEVSEDMGNWQDSGEVENALLCGPLLRSIVTYFESCSKSREPARLKEIEA